MQALGASLVAITPETPDNSLSTAEKNALAFDVCSDLDLSVSRSYGLVFQLYEELKPVYRAIAKDLSEWNASGTWELPIPATYVIDREPEDPPRVRRRKLRHAARAGRDPRGAPHPVTALHIPQTSKCEGALVVG